MSIATELGKSVNSLRESYEMLELAGGTLPAQLNANNLANSLWPVLDMDTDWGSVYYHTGVSKEWVHEEEECEVTNIDMSVFEAFVSEHTTSSEIYFEYMQEGDPETGEDCWVFFGEEEIYISPEDMPSTTGITVTIEEGIDWATISLSFSTVVDLESPLVQVALLNEEEYLNLTNKTDVTVGGNSVATQAIRRFVFGRNNLSTPNNFLRGYHNLSNISKFPEGFTTIGNYFLADCVSYDAPIDLNGVTVGTDFLHGCTSFNSHIILDNATIANHFMYNCTSFNQVLVLPSTLVFWGATTTNLFMGLNSLQEIVVERDVPSTVTDYIFGVYNAASLAYRNGVEVSGTYKDSWLALPNRASSPYRNFIGGQWRAASKLTLNDGIILYVPDSQLPNLKGNPPSDQPYLVVTWSATVAGVTFTCNNIKSLDCSTSELQSLPNQWMSGSSIRMQELILPPNLTTIKDYVLMGATCYSPVTIPEGVTSIGSYFCSYEGVGTHTLGGFEVYLPNNLQQIGRYFMSNGLGETSTYSHTVSGRNDKTFYNPCKVHVGSLSVSILNTDHSFSGAKWIGFEGETAVEWMNAIVNYWSGFSSGQSVSLYVCEERGLGKITTTDEREIVIKKMSEFPNAVYSTMPSQGWGVIDFSTGETKYSSEDILEFEAFTIQTAQVTYTSGTSVVTRNTLPLNNIALNCRNLVSFEYYTNITNIGDIFLQGCSNLEHLNIPNATSIGNNFLYGCHKFNEAIDVSNATSIGTQFLYDCTSFNSNITLPQACSLNITRFMSKCSSFAGTVTLPIYTLTGDSSACFYQCENLAGVNVGSNTPPSENIYTLTGNWQNGIIITGANRAAWLERFYNITGVRKLIDGGE